MTKFHCRRQFGMNFGNVTENGVNSNDISLWYVQSITYFSTLVYGLQHNSSKNISTKIYNIRL